MVPKSAEPTTAVLAAEIEQLNHPRIGEALVVEGARKPLARRQVYEGDRDRDGHPARERAAARLHDKPHHDRAEDDLARQDVARALPPVIDAIAVPDEVG